MILAYSSAACGVAIAVHDLLGSGEGIQGTTQMGIVDLKSGFGKCWRLRVAKFTILRRAELIT